jgi:hypothetical protein
MRRGRRRIDYRLLHLYIVGRTKRRKTIEEEDLPLILSQTDNR